MTLSEQKQKIEAASKLLSEESTTLEKFDSIRKLLVGINPKIDKVLASCSKSLSTLEKLQKGEVVELAAENLQTETEEQKRRKKAILFFIKHWKELKSEVERVKVKLEKTKESKTYKEQVSNFGSIAALAKGPFGLITALAVFIVLTLAFIRSNQSQQQTQTATVSPLAIPSPTPSTSPSIPTPKSTIRVITFNGKKIPLSELESRTGPDCTNSPREAPHYHAKNGQSAKALDGTIVPDPGACAYGKVEDTNIEEIQTP